MEGLEAVVYERPDEIDADEWSALAGDVDPRLHAPWFLTHVPETESVYVSLRREGSLCGLAPCLVWDRQEEWTTQRPGIAVVAPMTLRGPNEPGVDRTELIRTTYELLDFRFAPSLSVLALSTRFAFVSDLFPNEAALAERLIAEVDELASRRGAALWAILGVRESSELFETADDAGLLPALLTANTVLGVPSSFDEYLAGLARNVRTSVRRELRATAEHGVEFVDEADPASIAFELNAVATAHRARYGWPTPHAWPMDFATLKRAYGEDMRVVTARRDGQLLAYATLLSRGREHVTAYFADHSVLERGDFVHLNLAFYEIVSRVAADGGGTVQYGPTNYKAKLLRGCSLAPVWGLFKPLAPGLREPLKAHIRELNRLQKAHFEALSAFAR